MPDGIDTPEIKKGIEIGLKTRAKYTWYPCELCGKKRWVRLVRGQLLNRRCRACGNRGSRHYWKGGKIRTDGGYIIVKTYPSDFFYPMATKVGYIPEHRLVIAKSLNRCLLPWELVHHKNGVKDDNRIENLELITDKRFHMVDMQTKRLIVQLRKQVNEQDKRITLLEAENVLLRASARENYAKW